MQSSRCLTPFIFGLLVNSLNLSAAQPVTPEQQDVQIFMKRLYSYDPDTFENGEFEAATQKPYLLNKAPDGGNTSKYFPSKQCELIDEFFDRSIVKRTQKKSFVECDVINRFSHLSSEELSPATRSEKIARPLIEPPVVVGNNAKVVVYVRGYKSTEPGQALYDRNIFYLAKTDKGWRITNVLMIHGEGSYLTRPCGYESATKLTPEQFKDAPRECD